MTPGKLIYTIKAILLFFMLANVELFASGNANVDINFSTTSNGSWSFSGSGATALYTFTPSANSANILYTDISRLLMGTNAAVGDGSTGITNASTNGAGSVKILTSCSGAGSQSGNVTTSAIGVTAATSSSTQRTFYIVAAGSITISHAYDFTPASNASTGYPGTIIDWTAGTTIDINQNLTTTGGASSGSATGGAGGNITLTASGAVSVTYSLTSKGATGGSGAGAGLCIGGAGGAITISGTSITINGALDASGGAGRAASGSNGGVGGAISLTATSGTVVTAQTVTTAGGNAGTASGGTNGNGANAGSFSISATGNITIGGGTHTHTGGTGNTGTGTGGNGGAFSAVSSGGSVTVNQVITTKGGNAGSSATNANGGNGGTITLTAATTYYTAQNIVSSSGTSYGTGTANGGNITITGPSGVTIANGVTSTATTTGGTLTINDGNSTVTTGGGVNDGNTSAAMSVGAFTKTGSGTFALAFPGNSWTGNTTITAGTLYLSSTTAIPNSSNVTFNGGTLEMGTGNSETIGTITVAANSILKLGTGGKTLTYSPSNGISWTGQLTIKDWLGSTGGTSGYDGTGTSSASYPMIKSSGAAVELDATHLAKISFYRASNGLSYTATQLAASTAGEIVPTGTLPVELISFTAAKNNEQVNITWSTASEINSSYYNVLRSNDGSNFEIIHNTNAAGNSSSILNYFAIDKNPMKGSNYYKLVEYDFDGTHQESNVVEVDFEELSSTFTAYPNPTNNSCTFNFQSQNGGIYYLKVLSSLGQEVYNAMIAGNQGENKFTLSMNDFALGTYFFQLFDSTKKIADVKVVRD